tara:strand:+ start:829 stop:1032 length:204 start_codon:yes stop_codon:yes gene_type:complete
VKVTTATSVLLLGSPITTLLSYLFLGSTLSLVQAVGILLVVGGVVSVVMVGELGIKDKLFLVRRVKV